MKWNILQYGIKNEKSKNSLKRILAAACRWYSKWDSERFCRALEKKQIYVPEPLYTADDILRRMT